MIGRIFHDEMATEQLAAQRYPEKFFEDNDISRLELAEWLAVDLSTVSRKLSRERQWKEPEIKILLAKATKKLGRPVTFEEMFGLTPATSPR